MVAMRLDTEGRLLFFEAVPPQEERPRAAASTADWKRFFDRAGLPYAAFRPVPSRWTPPHYSDARFAWTGVHPRRPELPLRVEAASYHGVPVYFEVVWPWQDPVREAPSLSLSDDPFWAVLLLFYFGAMTLAALLAWRNLRLGRGDRRGAFRLVLFVFCCRCLYLIVAPHHVATMREVGIVISGLASAVYWGVLIGLLYLALEPFVRRRWPAGLISWSRMLAGDVRDPLVGRHVLIGGVLGIAAVVTRHLFLVVPPLLGRPMRAPADSSPLLYTMGLEGASGFLPLLINQVTASLLIPLIMTAVVLFIAVLTRRTEVAVAVSWLVFYGALNLNFGDGTWVGYVLGLILPTLLMVALLRYGLLALMSMFIFVHLSPFYPVTTELSAWYAVTFLMAVAVLIAVALVAFRIALAGQKVFEDALLDG